MARSKHSELKRQKQALGDYKTMKADVNSGSKSNVPSEVSRRTRVFKRWRPGTVANRAIKRSQRQTPPHSKAHVYRLMREFSSEFLACRFEDEAVKALRKKLTSLGVELFSAGNKVRQIMGNEATVTEKHMQIGRATMNIACLSDTWTPMYKKLGKGKREPVKADEEE